MTTRMAAPIIRNGRRSEEMIPSATGSTGAAGKGAIRTDTRALAVASSPRPAAVATCSRRASSLTVLLASMLALALMVTATEASVMVKEATSTCSDVSLSLLSRSFW